MKIVVISDVHGRTTWKDIVDNEVFADLFIFLGDYFDSFDIPSDKQQANFLDIIEFKKTSGYNVILLLGNHCLHYILEGETYSGYQERAAVAIKHLLESNKEHLRMCHLEKDILFSHAGVTDTWVNNNGWDKKQAIDEFINELWEYKPDSFRFVGSNAYGDSVESSPVWVRPRSLKQNAFQHKVLKQVVGHTSVDEITCIKKKFWLTDTQSNKKDYLVIEDGVFKIFKI